MKSNDEIVLYKMIDDMFPQKEYNCAQTVLLCAAEYFGLQNDMLKDIAAPFGGGLCMTRMSVCGAISGAIIFIGLKEADNKKEAYVVGKEFLDFIDKKYKDRCCDKILGIDFSDEESKAIDDVSYLQAICKPLVIDVCEWLIARYDK